MAGAKIQRRPRRTTTGSTTKPAKSVSHGGEGSRCSAGRSSGKTANFSTKANVGQCPKCGKTIEKNPDVIAYCDCYSKCDECDGPLILLHKINDAARQHFEDAFDLGTRWLRVIGLCPACLSIHYEPPFEHGISEALPVEVQLLHCSGPASSKPMHSVGALSGRSPVPRGRGAETFYKGGDSHS